MLEEKSKMQKQKLWVVLLLVNLLMYSCGPALISQPPTSSSTSTATAELKKNSHLKISLLTPINSHDECKLILISALPINQLRAELWMIMKNGGHGAPPITIQKVYDKIFILSEIFFSMGGQWELRLFDEKQLVETIPFDVP